MIKKTLFEFFRSPIKNLILIIVFSISFIGLCFAVNYYNYIQTNISNIDKSFTTIAVPDTQAIEKFVFDTYYEESIETDSEYLYEADFYLLLHSFVDSSRFGILDNCQLLRGVTNSVSPVLSGAINPLEYNDDFDYPQNNAAFIVTAMDVEYYSKMFQKNGFLYSGGGTFDSAHYIVKFRVDQALILNPCYKVPEFVYAMSGAFTRDLQSPFECGKQYFISGIYHDISIIQKERDNGTLFSDMYNVIDENSVPNIHLDGSLFVFDNNIRIKDREAPIKKSLVINNENTMAYTYTERDLSLMCIPYEGHLDSLKAIHPDITTRLQRAIVNSNSIEIRTTTNLESVLYFNQGKSVIMDGRNFTAEEISLGMPVCIVSEPFASFNNLKVGDDFSVDLYNTLVRRMNGGTWSLAPYNNSQSDTSLFEMEKYLGSLELKVVGIYTTPPRKYSAYSLNYNTIFVPSNTVPVKLERKYPDKMSDLKDEDLILFTKYSHHMIPSLFTVIIPNDKLDEFKAEVKEAGFENYFIYNDQGYSQIIDVIPLIRDTAQTFFIAAIIGFFSVFVLFLVLLPRKLHEFGMLISLGVKRSIVIMSTLYRWFLVMVPAISLCFIVTILSNASLAKEALISSIRQLQYNNAFSPGAQDSVIDVSLEFSSWTNDYNATLLMLLGILIIYLVTAMTFYLWESKQSVLKLLRRKE